MEFNPVSVVTINKLGDILYGGSFGLAIKQAEITGDWIADDHVITPTIPVNEVTSIDTVTNQINETFIAVATTSGISLFEQKIPIGIRPVKKFFTAN